MKGETDCVLCSLNSVSNTICKCLESAWCNMTEMIHQQIKPCNEVMTESDTGRRGHVAAPCLPLPALPLPGPSFAAKEMV